ncbi:COPI associated protein-domain-containing protein [Gongronella butleri]|nr:COPI associated protein-domain-containing protein [Gongronella butleri]
MSSRAKITNAFLLLLNLVNLALYALVITAVVFKCMDGQFATLAVCIYGGLIAVGLIVHEFRQFQVVVRYFPFICLYFGRGMTLIWLGCVVLDGGVVNILTGAACLVFGCIHIILHFIPDFAPPNSLAVNWQHWRAREPAPTRVYDEMTKRAVHPPPFEARRIDMVSPGLVRPYEQV